MVDAYTMTSQIALHILATDNFTDQFGIKRCVSLYCGCGLRVYMYRHIGDEWLVTSEQCESYIPDVTEVHTHTPPHTSHTPIHTHLTHPPHIHPHSHTSHTPSQDMQRVINLTVIKSHQYAVVLDPVGQDNKNKLGCRELRVGPTTFFLHPGNTNHAIT